jgi:hypothetical protein
MWVGKGSNSGVAGTVDIELSVERRLDRGRCVPMDDAHARVSLGGTVTKSLVDQETSVGSLSASTGHSAVTSFEGRVDQNPFNIC